MVLSGAQWLRVGQVSRLFIDVGPTILISSQDPSIIKHIITPGNNGNNSGPKTISQT